MYGIIHCTLQRTYVILSQCVSESTGCNCVCPIFWSSWSPNLNVMAKKRCVRRGTWISPQQEVWFCLIVTNKLQPCYSLLIRVFYRWYCEGLVWFLLLQGRRQCLVLVYTVLTFEFRKRGAGKFSLPGRVLGTQDYFCCTELVYWRIESS